MAGLAGFILSVAHACPYAYFDVGHRHTGKVAWGKFPCSRTNATLLAAVILMMLGPILTADYLDDHHHRQSEANRRGSEKAEGRHSNRLHPQHMFGLVGLCGRSLAVWLVRLGRGERRRGPRPGHERPVNFDRHKGSRADQSYRHDYFRTLVITAP